VPIEEGLAVIVDAHVRDAERGALVDDLPEQIEAHDALPPVHVVARTEHALRVADVRALDLDDLRQDRRAVASRREQQPAHRLRVAAQRRFRRAAGCRLQACGSGHGYGGRSAPLRFAGRSGALTAAERVR
jgi:hypothetical protein